MGSPGQRHQTPRRRGPQPESSKKPLWRFSRLEFSRPSGDSSAGALEP